MDEITREMKMGDIVRNFPNTIEVMLEHGLHCIGCHVAQFETLEQGCMAHGMSEKEIGELLNKMNQAIKKHKGGKNSKI
jgi:hybrid cluster-associated redox disulfide protein